MALLARALGGRLEQTVASDPLGRPVRASFAICGARRVGVVEERGPGETAIVEMAQASGLALVAEHERDAWAASTRGTGELVLAAVAAGAREILVAVGGSATTDGGWGAIEAIRAGGGLRGARIAVLCDVETAFEDAARVFGPQKGADAAMVDRLGARLAQLAGELPRDPRGVPATGAAGGLSGGLWAAFDAELRPGAAAVLDALRVDERMRRGAARGRGRGLSRRAEPARQDRRRARPPGSRGRGADPRGGRHQQAVGGRGRARRTRGRIDRDDARGDRSRRSGTRHATALACRSVADVAQLVEHFTRNEGVRGSSPRVGSQGCPANEREAFRGCAPLSRVLRSWSNRARRPVPRARGLPGLETAERRGDTPTVPLRDTARAFPGTRPFPAQEAHARRWRRTLARRSVSTWPSVRAADLRPFARGARSRGKAPEAAR